MREECNLVLPNWPNPYANPPKYLGTELPNIYDNNFPEERVIFINGREKYCKKVITAVEALGYFLWKDDKGNPLPIGRNTKDRPYYNIGLIWLNYTGLIGFTFLPLNKWEKSQKRRAIYLKDLVSELQNKLK